MSVRSDSAMYHSFGLFIGDSEGIADYLDTKLAQIVF
jgi:hypothetical protein